MMKMGQIYDFWELELPYTQIEVFIIKEQQQQQYYIG